MIQTILDAIKALAASQSALIAKVHELQTALAACQAAHSQCELSVFQASGN